MYLPQMGLRIKQLRKLRRISQKELGNVKDLENNVLKLGEKLIPLVSSYTQTAEGGRPVKEQGEKAPKTIQNETSKDNQTGGASN